MESRRLRLGTRASPLALVQTERVAERLGGAEIVTVTTAGDRGVRAGDTPFGAQDKSRWVDGLERALLHDEIDLAVHSAKDVPGELPAGLALVGVPERVDARDALCGAPSLEALPEGARVGTSSLRRQAQLRALRADLRPVVLRGNVDTRLGKLAAGQAEAIVLARAGLERLGRLGDVGGLLDPEQVVPAPGQGALALEGRADDEEVAVLAAALSDPVAVAELRAERAVVTELRATCHTPIGAHARAAGDEGLALSVWVGLPDGSTWIADRLEGPRAEPEALGRAVSARLRTLGADELLARAEAVAA